MNPWLLTYEGFDPATEGVREALCTLGNGYFATRGAAPEAAGDGTHYPGTYIAGCYDRLVSEVEGRLIDAEDLVNAPNWLPVTFRAEDGEWFGPSDPLSYHQELDMRRGVLTRLARLRDGRGRVVRVSQRRVVSMDQPHLAALETTIAPENWSGRMEIRTALDGGVTNSGVARYRALRGRHLRTLDAGTDGDEVIWLHTETVGSRIEIAVAARNRVLSGGGAAFPATSSSADLAAAPDDAAAGAESTGVDEVPGERVTRIIHRDEDVIGQRLIVDVAEGGQITLEKTIALFTSRDRAIADCAGAARLCVRRAPEFETLLQRHRLAWERLWRRCRIEVDHAEAQQLVNLHIFHVLQTVSEHTVELDVGIPARGLHGEAYRGHVFWDELFVLPFFNLRFPEIARAMLMYRWRRLPEARWAARATGLPGAMFPWQSASDGREATPRFHLNPRSGRWLPDNSYLQRHVGLAVAYNVWKFYEATGDLEFLAEYGAELTLEIARFFAGLATYDRVLDRYEIRGVMGPDEYHDGYPHRDEPGLDNNSYTNVMTVWVLCRALEILDILPEARRVELVERLSLTPEEIARFDDVSRKMRVVFTGDVIAQFEGYDALAELDWAAYRHKYGDIRRMDRILEAEGDTTNRYQVSKQADVVMLFYLLAPDEVAAILDRLGYGYDEGLIKRTIRYSLDRTTHGSTLSAVVHAWVLAQGGGPDSWRFFLDALHADIDDGRSGTTAEGIHIGAMAGSLDLLQRCYAGVMPHAGRLHLNPRLAQGLPGVRLELRYRGQWGITVRCTHDRLHVSVSKGVTAPIELAVGDQMITLEPGGSWETELPAPA